LELVVWTGSPLKAELTVAGVAVVFDLDLSRGKEVEVDFISCPSDGIFVVHRFLNKFSSSGLTNGTEIFLWSSP
jgi:hypothetical protein